MELLKQLEHTIVDQLVFEAKDPSDEGVKAAIEEWKLMKKKLAVIEKMGKALSAQIEELEENFKEIIEEVEDNRIIVDTAIVEFNKKKGNTTVKYKEVVEYTLNMVNEAQKEVITKFMESVTKSGEIRNVLSITDPELEKYLTDLKSASGDELMAKIETQARTGFERLPKQVANAKKRDLKESVVKSIATVVKNLVSKFKTVFSKYFAASKKSKAATAAFLKAVRSE